MLILHGNCLGFWCQHCTRRRQHDSIHVSWIVNSWSRRPCLCVCTCSLHMQTFEFITLHEKPAMAFSPAHIPMQILQSLRHATFGKWLGGKTGNIMEEATTNDKQKVENCPKILNFVFLRYVLGLWKLFFVEPATSARAIRLNCILKISSTCSWNFLLQSFLIIWNRRERERTAVIRITEKPTWTAVV